MRRVSLCHAGGWCQALAREGIGCDRYRRENDPVEVANEGGRVGEAGGV